MKWKEPLSLVGHEIFSGDSLLFTYLQMESQRGNGGHNKLLVTVQVS